MKKELKVLCLSGLLVFLTSCGAPKSQVVTPSQVSSTIEVADSSVVGAESFKQFAAASGSLILQGKGNQLYGAVGPYQLLGLLSEGATGQSKTEIYQTLYTDTKNFPSLRLFNQELLTDYQDEAVASMANSVWFDEQLKVAKSFEKVAKDQFSAEVNEVPFAKDSKKATKKIRSWVKKQLDADLFDQSMVTDKTRLMLINTVRLNLAWVEEFEEKQTQEEVFYAENNELRTDFMHQSQRNYSYARGDNYLASSLALENNHRLLFILPDEEVPVNQLIETSEKLAELIKIGETEVADVNFAIPKFKLTNELELVDVMQQLGLKQIFDENKADLSRLTETGEPLFITQFIQNNQLELDEEKVKVESVTSMTADTSSAMAGMKEVIDLTLNRPFIFIIQGKDSLPLFMGIVRNPQLTK